MKPIIGITGNETRKTDTAFLDTSVLRTFASKSLSQIVIDKGGLPLIMPIAAPDLAIDYIDQIDKLIITGGQNVSPSLYGQEQTIKSTDYHLQRDLFEVALIQEAMAQGKPIFGICRGLQIINVALGGSFFQHFTLGSLQTRFACQDTTTCTTFVDIGVEFLVTTTFHE